MDFMFRGIYSTIHVPWRIFFLTLYLHEITGELCDLVLFYFFLIPLCRSWPGIPANELLQVNTLRSMNKPVAAGALSAETAAVTTAKNTLAHLATMEARDAAYVVSCFLFIDLSSYFSRM